jgi:uncharacterized protein (TIGR02266 family)
VVFSRKDLRHDQIAPRESYGMTDEAKEQAKETTRILQVRSDSGEAFLKGIVEAGASEHELRYPTKIPLTMGEQVIVEIVFPELPGRIMLRGQVSALEPEPQAARIRFATEEQETLDFVLRVARGETDPGSSHGRRYYRLPLEIPVDWQISGQGDVVISSTDDVSGGGVQIRTQNPPPVGTEVVLVLTMDDEPDGQLRIPGRVAWVRTDESFSGMGVRFTTESTEEKKRIRDRIRKYMERGAVSK